jgi:hypothetical protein
MDGAAAANRDDTNFFYEPCAMISESAAGFF